MTEQSKENAVEFVNQMRNPAKNKVAQETLCRGRKLLNDIRKNTSNHASELTILRQQLSIAVNALEGVKVYFDRDGDVSEASETSIVYGVNNALAKIKNLG